MARIFLCYDSEDKPRVRDIYRRLWEAGYQPWLDEEDLAPGQSWVQAIPSMLQDSDLILLFLSQHTRDDHGDFQGDLRRALDAWEGILGSVNPALLVRLDRSEIPDVLRRFQWVDYFAERDLARLIQVIRTALLDRHSQPAVTPARELLRDTILQTDEETASQKYDIFLSYASGDLNWVRRLVSALERYGWSVWWDRSKLLPGQKFTDFIAEALRDSRCIVVVWSRASVNSY
jgi:hypothetical protein